MIQLIMLETPIIVNDEEVKEGELYVNNGKFFHADAKFDKGNNPNNSNPRVTDHNFKIIAGISKLPSINFNGFEEQLGIVDVEKLALETYRDNPSDLKGADYKYNTDLNAPRKRKAFIKGFKLSQQLNEKKFSLEDMRLAYVQGTNDGALFESICQANDGVEDSNEADLFAKQAEAVFDKSLQQPKIYNIEVEMEEAEEYDIVYGHKNKFPRPLITNNRIKITKIL